MTDVKIEAFAKNKGYDGAEYAGQWRDYSVYNPTIKGSTERNPAIVGLPLIILVKGEEIRLSDVDEAFAYLDDMIKESRYEEISEVKRKDRG